MKRKYIFIVAIGALFLSAGVFSAVRFATEDTNSSDLTLANIEAMAVAGGLDENLGEFSKVERITEQVGGKTVVYCECSGQGTLPCC